MHSIEKIIAECNCSGRRGVSEDRFTLLLAAGKWFHMLGCPVPNERERDLVVEKPSYSLADAQAVMCSTDDPEKWGLANTIVQLTSANRILETLCENAQVELYDLKGLPR
jgi:hypothetical protein